MSRQVLFIQGGGAGVHDEWDHRLVDSLARKLGSGYEIRYPRMPDEEDPSYARWKAAIKEERARLTSGAVLAGHSIGATILINALADEPSDQQRLSGIFLLSPPYVGHGGWPAEDIKPMADLGKRLAASTPIYIYHGSKDDTVPREHIDLYAQAIPRALIRELPGRDHQLDNDLSEVAADIRQLG